MQLFSGSPIAFFPPAIILEKLKTQLPPNHSNSMTNTIKGLSVLTAILFCIQLSKAQDSSKDAWFQSMDIKGYLSFGYNYNFNNPDLMKNQYRVFDFDANNFKIDVVELSFSRNAAAPGQTGFRADLMAGSSIPRVTQASGLNIGDLDLPQLFFSYDAPMGNGLRIDAGKFITSMGFEYIDSYDGDNDNCTRSLLFGYGIPFTHTGIKASYAFNDNVSAMVMAVNGWDNSIDNNKSKTLCVQLGLVPLAGMNLTTNYMFGPEKVNNDADNRNILDIVFTDSLMDGIVVGLNGDYGTEQHSGLTGGDAVWRGIAGYLRVNVWRNFSLIVRAEQFEDRDGIRTGINQKLQEITLTPEYHPAEHFILRADLRIDKSDKDVFQRRGDFVNTQSTIGVNIGYVW